MARIAIIGAGGKMGGRITDNLLKTDHEVRHVEVSDRGIANLAERGLKPRELRDALNGADAVILAVPDNRIGRVAKDLSDALQQCLSCSMPRRLMRGRCPTARI